MRLRLKPDPKHEQKRQHAYRAAHPLKVQEWNRRSAARKATPEGRARHNFIECLRYYNDRLEILLRGRERRGNIGLALSRARVDRFEQINRYRERGLDFKEIDKILGGYKAQRGSRSQNFMAHVQKSWDKGNADGRAWAASRDPASVKAVYRFMTDERDLFDDMQAELTDDVEFQLLKADAIYQDGWYNGVCEVCSPSYKVRRRFERSPIKGKCIRCGSQFEGVRYGGKIRRFCSENCRKAAWRQRRRIPEVCAVVAKREAA
jgi:hypothetical protein